MDTYDFDLQYTLTFKDAGEIRQAIADMELGIGKDRAEELLHPEKTGQADEKKPEHRQRSLEEMEEAAQRAALRRERRSQGKRHEPGRRAHVERMSRTDREKAAALRAAKTKRERPAGDPGKSRGLMIGAGVAVVVIAVIIGAISVPGIALAVPQFLLFAKLNLTNTPWAMIIPSLVSTFGLYLMWIFSDQAVPTELLEAARVDGAGEFRTFFQVSLPLLAPGIVTTALFTIVATWNNYFLPLIMLKDSNWYPLTIGLNQWKDQASTAGGQAIQNLVVTGSLITIVPLVIAFLCLQKYWQSGLAAGAVKE